MHKKTHILLDKMQAGYMPNAIELMAALSILSDELYEDSQAGQNSTEATNACLSGHRHDQNRCSSCG